MQTFTLNFLKFDRIYFPHCSSNIAFYLPSNYHGLQYQSHLTNILLSQNILSCSHVLDMFSAGWDLSNDNMSLIVHF